MTCKIGCWYREKGQDSCCINEAEYITVPDSSPLYGGKTSAYCEITLTFPRYVIYLSRTLLDLECSKIMHYIITNEWWPIDYKSESFSTAVMGAECCGAAKQVLGRMGWSVHNQCIYSRLGTGGWVRIRWVGEHDELHTPNRHLWTIHQVLPMPSSSSYINTNSTISSAAKRHRITPSSPPTFTPSLEKKKKMLSLIPERINFLCKSWRRKMNVGVAFEL